MPFHNRSFASIGGIALAVAATLPLLASPLAAQDFPDLRGAWSGTGWGAHAGDLRLVEAAPEPSFKDPTVVFTLEVKEQKNGGLIGTWSTSKASETLIGVIKPDNKGVLFVDEDSYLSGTLRSENEMEVCLQESTGKSMIASCYVLTRQ